MDAHAIQRYLKEAEGKPYGFWRRFAGSHRLPGFSFTVDHIQGDVYAPPSRLSLRLALTDTALKRTAIADPLERLACEDLAFRRFAAQLPEESVPAGDAAGGRLSTLIPGPEILPRSAVKLENGELVFHFTFTFPAVNRRILTEPVTDILFFRLPALTADVAAWLTPERLDAHLTTLRRSRALRAALESRNLCAFLPDGAVLARDGVGPLRNALPFKVPEALRSTLEADGFSLAGLAIPRGLTVLVGPAFHGKTTVLEAISQGIFDHLPGDGRENCVSLAGTAFPCLEEDRAVRAVDLSFFIRSLPGNRDVHSFTTAAASGATSQAAAILEALAAQSPLLLLDEDASAANLLTRDERISALFSHGETLTPLAERARELVNAGISLIVVAGASSRWLDLADHIFVLEDYQPTLHRTVPQPSSEATPPAAAIPEDFLQEVFGLRPLPPNKIRLTGTHIRFGGEWFARLPARGFSAPRARGAAHLLLAFLRHAPEVGSATFSELKKWYAEQQRQGPKWPDATSGDLEMPALQEIIAVVQRLEKENS